MNAYSTGVSWRQRLLAITTGFAFAIGSLTIVMGSELWAPTHWTSQQALTVLMIFGTIAAGHLMADAARARYLLAVAGFAILFVSGTALVVYQSVGRQAETTETVQLSAEATNTALADKGAELKNARRRLADANEMVTKEMTGERCGIRCENWKTRAKEVQAGITQLETEIQSIGPAKPIAPKAEKMAAVAAVFGADEARAKAALMLAEPFFWTLFFEFGSIVSLGYAFRSSGRRAAVPECPTPAKLDVPDIPDSLDKVVKLRPATRLTRKQDVIADMLQRLHSGQQFGSQDELIELYDVPKATLSDWLAELEANGSVKRIADGRKKRLAAA